MKQIAVAACLLGALIPAVASADGLYAGGSLLIADRSGYDNVDSSTGGKLVFGYSFAPAPIFIEASYLDTGKADIDEFGYDGVSIKYSGITLGAGLILPISRWGSGFWIRGDYYTGDAEVEDPDFGDGKESASGGGLGIGFDWMFNPMIGVRLEYQALFEVEDFADNENISMFGAGVVIHFPGTGTQPAPRRRRGY